jgi:hypothetical protein
LIAWCHDARSLLQQRNVMIHASMSLGAGQDGELVPHRWSLRDTTAIDSEAEDVQRLVTSLTRLRHFGVLLQHSLCYPARGVGAFRRRTSPSGELPCRRSTSRWSGRRGRKGLLRGAPRDRTPLGEFEQIITGVA